MITVFLFLLTSASLANHPSSKKLILEFAGGANAGWWIFNRGTTENNPDQDQTSLALFVPIQLNILYKINLIKIGTGITHSLMFKTEMKNSSNSGLYPIAKNAVTFNKISIISEYDIYNGDFYTLSPQVKFGWFDINTIHLDKNNFKNKIFWEFGISNQLQFSSFSFIIRPVYNHANINSQLGDIKNREHNFYNIGIMLGLRFLLF